MDQRLTQVEMDYQKAVLAALKLLAGSGIPPPKTCFEWAFRNIPQNGPLGEGVSYFKHGFGCELKFPDFVLDFDFDDEGRIAEPDAWRLVRFSINRLADYGFESARELEQVHKLAGATRLMHVV